MLKKTVWLVSFVLSFLACLAAVAYRLGWLQAFSYHQYQAGKAREKFLSEIRDAIIPNFSVNIHEGNTLGIFELIESSRSLVLFLGPGCAPCDDHTINIIAEFEKTKAREIGLDIIVLVYHYDHEFVHLRKLTTYNFQGKVAKFSSTNGYDVPKYPALYLVEKESQKMLDAHFPRAGAENQLRNFLKSLVNSKSSGSYSPNKTLQDATSSVRITSPKDLVNTDAYKARQSTKDRKLILYKRFRLEHNVDKDLLSQITVFSIGTNGELFFSHDYGDQISVFNNEGAFLATITTEDIFGPGSRNTRSCSRILPLNETKAYLLFFGFVKELIIYDWKRKAFDFMSLKHLNEHRAHSIVDVAISEDRLYLLSHPQRTLGYFSRFAEIIELDYEGRKRNRFAAFPDLKFPNLAEHLALDRDQIVLSKGNILYTSSPLGDRIYRFDLSGNRLGDLIYPKGFIVQLDRDAQEDYREWYKHYHKFGNIDIIKEIFCVRKDNVDNIVIVRRRGRSLYFDMFDKTGMFTELGEYSDYFEYFMVANREDLFYGYRWPEVKDGQFVAYGNPEIVVYRLAL